MKETVLITGANSFIASHIIPLLESKYQLKFLTRSPKNTNEYQWDVHNQILQEGALDDVQYIIHLAGSKLNDGSPLTEERKALVYESRIGAANFLRNELKRRNQTIKSFVSASAIGYYGYQDSTLTIDENGKKGIGFAADLSDDWEKAADQWKEDGTAEHVAKIRVSIVLGNNGGIFPMYKNIVQQNPNVLSQPNPSYVPWNHVVDMAGIFAFAVENQLDGVYNSVAQPASQHDIFTAIANELGNEKQNITPFSGQHLISKKIENEGYVFKYPTIASAVKQLLSKESLTQK